MGRKLNDNDNNSFFFFFFYHKVFYIITEAKGISILEDFAILTDGKI